MTKQFDPPQELDIDKLFLDEKNPRIPLDKRKLSQDELVAYVADSYFALAIAESIAAHQFFPSEPLIAIPGKKSDEYIVVEGNRRLAALKLLLHPDLRDKLRSRKEWDALSASNSPKKVPVVVVDKRRDVAPIIGYRHISGIQQWDADAKARYIADQVDEGLSFEETAKEVGENENAVRMHYRNHHIARQAEGLKGKQKISPEALHAMKRDFGTFTRAMQSGNLLTFIGAPSPAKVVKDKLPVPASKKDALKEMVEMLFGPTAVLEESRDVTELGKAISTKEGLAALRKTRNLEEALMASRGVLEKLIQRLSSAARSLRSAKDDFPKHKKNVDVLKLVKDCADALNELK